MYRCETTSTGAYMESEKLPPILKALRNITEYRFKIPHGNKVRTLILEQGACCIVDPFTDEMYIITVRRW